MLTYTYTRLLTHDFPNSFRFYRDVMRFTPTLATENDIYAEFETGGTTLALFVRGYMAEVVAAQDKPAVSDSQDAAALCFSVEDVDQAYQELQDKGIAFVTPPQDRVEWGIRTAHFRDPDGNLLEIYTALS